MPKYPLLHLFLDPGGDSGALSPRCAAENLLRTWITFNTRQQTDGAGGRMKGKGTNQALGGLIAMSEPTVSRTHQYSVRATGHKRKKSSTGYHRIGDLKYDKPCVAWESSKP